MSKESEEPTYKNRKKHAGIIILLCFVLLLAMAVMKTIQMLQR